MKSDDFDDTEECPLSVNEWIMFINNEILNQTQVIESRKASFQSERNFITSTLSMFLVGLVAIVGYIRWNAFYSVVITVTTILIYSLSIRSYDQKNKKEVNNFISERLGYISELEQLNWKILYNVYSDPKEIRLQWFTIINNFALNRYKK